MFRLLKQDTPAPASLPASPQEAVGPFAARLVSEHPTVGSLLHLYLHLPSPTVGVTLLHVALSIIQRSHLRSGDRKTSLTNTATLSKEEVLLRTWNTPRGFQDALAVSMSSRPRQGPALTSTAQKKVCMLILHPTSGPWPHERPSPLAGRRRGGARAPAPTALASTLQPEHARELEAEPSNLARAADQGPIQTAGRSCQGTADHP